MKYMNPGKRRRNRARTLTLMFVLLLLLSVCSISAATDKVFYAKVNGHVLPILAAENSSADAFLELLKSGDVTIDMHDYGSFEKVGPLGTTLPRNDEQITTAPGDVILYQGNQVTIYYDVNTWSFTRLGKITGVSQTKLKKILSEGDATVTFSLSAGKKWSANSNVLVVVFSRTGHTKPLAEYTAEILSADLYEIEAKDPYTDDDIKYYTDCRADREQKDPSARPEIAGELPDLSAYDTIFLGYPIWHGQAPKIIYTFLEAADVSGKRIIPFCTSAASPLGTSAENLHALVAGAEWDEGRRFEIGTTKETISEWVKTLSISEKKTEHVHSLIEHDKVEATEDAEGMEAYWECSVCNMLFSDEEGKNEIENPIAIPKLEPTTPEGKIKAFVKRCYKLILNRDADEGGLKGWSDALTSKTATAAQIIDGFVRSQEFINRNLGNDAAVDILYNTMLNRAADADGKAGWVDALSKGYTLQNIIDGFCGSPEFKAICDSYGIEPGSVGAATPADTSTPRGKIEAFVKRCYKLILSRDADEGGLKGWSDALESRQAAAAQIIDGFVRSEEYTNRKLSAGESVDILYKTMLDRNADEGGKAGWVDALGQGFTLQHIINGFCGSAEFTAICENYGIVAGSVAVSGAVVKREAIAPEGEEAAPVVVGEYRSEFINEEKIKDFVEHCYKAVFGREGDAEGIENYTRAILDGKKSPRKLAYEFIFSPEFQNNLPGNQDFIRILYRLYFDREPGAEELAGWVQMLEDGASLEDIVNGFAGSSEFKAIINDMKE